MIPDTWRFDPLPLSAAVIGAALYARAFLELRRRGRPDHASAASALAFAAGVSIACLALVSPLDALAEDTLLSAHMLQHLLLGDVAPLLLVLGLRGPIAFFLLPAPLLQRLARNSGVRRALAVVLQPRVSFAFWAATLALWHVPRVYDAALAHPALHALEHACLFLGGLLLWAQLVDPTHRRVLTAGRRAGLATGALLAGMVLSELLLATRSLYPSYARAIDRPFGLTQATDQTRAAALMMIEQVATLGLAAALLFRAHVEETGRQLARVRVD